MTEITIGSAVGAPDVPARLDASRFNRHTFWCGQSGSGKTYALGVVLEQLLLHTELPMVVLDPNADFVRLPESREDADRADSARLSELDIRVFRSSAGAGERLHARYLDLSPASKAALMQLDPIADAEEYNVLLHADVRAEHFDPTTAIDRMRASTDPGEVRLSYRMENLQVLEWDLWSRGGNSVVDVIDERPRATVLDLGGFQHPAESKVAALAVLEHLWTRREERRPILVVIDEAHNICSPDPQDDVERALTRQLVQIAAEGRKFGLWLLLSTQRPNKIHPNVLSQCDNLGLMRVNSPRDLLELAEVFGFAGEDQIRRSASFAQGQALFAGGFVSEPTYVQMGRRITEESGGDVRVPLRDDR
ncbi:MAG: ATP-binding protein [Dietzia sp.]|uniref:ATP-binding protein n=1 Tax=Dietzia TaxID=37914 RepID=UPI0015FA78AD|nr:MULTISPECIES: ATP-binding protein [Dietzia]MBB1053830.1 ATP-binding protein [Dietzia sp. B44]MBB1055939.1 ATP-binding protein [Dietzia sp. B19]MBC7294794.1 ATP-binding protein [Dietzia sp.]MCT1515535.1 ATP-binding protein [Dietzia cercidiphylli]MDO8393394.1 ATP-binding protein [Dietzia sp.]